MPVMPEKHPNSYTTFDGHRRIASGSLLANALAAKRAFESQSAGPVLIFEDTTGRPVDVDTRGTEEEVITRFASVASAHAEPDDDQDAHPEASSPRGRGRPKLGVVAREVTLLPRHWDWLAAQPGGASVILRKLVEAARHASVEKDKRRMAQERAYHFMEAIGGDLPGFEEAIRALFADNASQVYEILAAWPCDVRDHVMQLAFGDEYQRSSSRD